MKPFAVVKFPLENSIGTICTKWITAGGKECFYPASKAEMFNMNIILKKEKEAMPGWDSHPIIFMKDFGR